MQRSEISEQFVSPFTVDGNEPGVIFDPQLLSRSYSVTVSPRAWSELLSEHGVSNSAELTINVRAGLLRGRDGVYLGAYNADEHSIAIYPDGITSTQFISLPQEVQRSFTSYEGVVGHTEYSSDVNTLLKKTSLHEAKHALDDREGRITAKNNLRYSRIRDIASHVAGTAAGVTVALTLMRYTAKPITFFESGLVIAVSALSFFQVQPLVDRAMYFFRPIELAARKFADENMDNPQNDALITVRSKASESQTNITLQAKD